MGNVVNFIRDKHITDIFAVRNWNVDKSNWIELRLKKKGKNEDTHTPSYFALTLKLGFVK